MISKYDSGNEHLNKLHELIQDMRTYATSNYNSWEVNFLSNMEDQMQEFEIGDKNLTDGQKDKIDELYREHLEE